jgi:large subunit ribosomal protein L34
MKRTLQRNKNKRLKKHGFLNRNASASGIRVLKRRRLKGRKKLTVSDE